MQLERVAKLTLMYVFLLLIRPKYIKWHYETMNTC